VAADVLFALLGWLYARSHHLLTSPQEREHDHILVLSDDDDAEDGIDGNGRFEPQTPRPTDPRS
jgi:hypothetical protein